MGDCRTHGEGTKLVEIIREVRSHTGSDKTADGEIELERISYVQFA
jgi:hypothetical protein